jgi:sporulation protein YlmC with PRC-barrel domain
MKARLCLVASVLLMAAPAFAQEPLDKLGTEPSMSNDQAAPAATPDPMDKIGADPSTPGNQAAPAATPEPIDHVGTEPSHSSQPAAAQADAPAEVVITDLTAVDDNKKLVKPWGVPADSVAQMDVYDNAGKKIGQVDTVLQDKNGEIKGVAVGYGGFLGFGEKGAIVTLDQLKLKDGALVTDISEDQLSTLPEWLKK